MVKHSVKSLVLYQSQFRVNLHLKRKLVLL